MAEPQVWNGMVIDGHLGGYFPGGDPNSYYPVMWTKLRDELDIKTAIDVGCGDPDSGSCRWFAEHLDGGVIGIDGLVENVMKPNVVLAKVDYTTHSFRTEVPVDLVWSCEFVEHVEERFMPNYLGTFMCGRWLAMTHALPGQTSGHHHVNLQGDDYWIGALAACGFMFEPKLTERARSWAAAERIPGPENYFARSGLVFRHVSEVHDEPTP